MSGEIIVCNMKKKNTEAKIEKSPKVNMNRQPQIGFFLYKNSSQPTKNAAASFFDGSDTPSRFTELFRQMC